MTFNNFDDVVILWQTAIYAQQYSSSPKYHQCMVHSEYHCKVLMRILCVLMRAVEISTHAEVAKHKAETLIWK